LSNLALRQTEPWELFRSGRRSRSRVFLAQSSGGYVYYTVVLTKSGDMLSGFYSASVPFDPADQAAVTLRHIGN
jgi:hypothetical protein